MWAQPTGSSLATSARNVGRLFFPQSASLGLDRGEASCSVLAKITYAGVMAGTSFRGASCCLDCLAELDVSAKQVERVVRRIGSERCEQRDQEVEAFLRLPLTEKAQAPPGVSPPELAVVMADGGRLQILNRCRESDDSVGAGPAPDDEPSVEEASAQQRIGAGEVSGALPDVPVAAADQPPVLPGADEEDDQPSGQAASKSRHWKEDRVGLLLSMSSPMSQADPCPDIPQHFIDPCRIEKLSRELKAKTRANATTAAESGPVQAEPPLDEEASWEPPEVQARKVVASRRPWRAFGPILAAAAWSLGFFAAARRAFVGDGSAHHWGVWRRHFSTFVPILDLIHGIAYVYAAALAGRSHAEGWPVYVRWIQWVWQGEVQRVLEEVKQRQQEVGVARKEDKEGSPPVVLKEALTFLENHKGQMKYPEYRQQGLPITSSHVESEIKRINHRVKGTEKFWSEEGAEWILQLRADYLSDDKPMETFWEKRQAEETGQRRYRKRQ
jgi:hypothetical protein